MKARVIRFWILILPIIGLIYAINKKDSNQEIGWNIKLDENIEGLLVLLWLIIQAVITIYSIIKIIHFLW